ncbi:MAG: hypothetical protein Q7W56_02795 [Candidatus Latescibacteria bacterium]|nr:hypothetical protein [Candidatus Latescibacterota bacterium]
MSAERQSLPAGQTELLLFLTAVLGRLPALGAWWHGADWELLGRARGLAGAGEAPAFWFSQIAYWKALGPLLGAAPGPWAVTRLLLHGAAAALAHRLALRAGGSRTGAFAAALLVSVSPFAFAPLYRAFGIAELLGATLSLLCVERLLAGGPRAAATAVFAGLLALLSQECALGLPVLAAALALGGDRAHRRQRLAAAAVLTVAAGLASALLLRSADAPGHVHALPHLAYAAWIAAAVVLGSVLARRRAAPRMLIALLLPFAAAALSWGAMEWRLARRGADGLPADPAVRSTAVSHEALQTLRAVPAGPAKRLAILQPAALHAAQVGDPAADGAYPTLVRVSLAGDLGPALLGPLGTTVVWTTDPDRIPPDATVLLDAGARLLYWGPAPQAFLYLTLTQIGLGRAAEAAGVFERGLRRSPPTLSFQFDAGQLPVTPDAVRDGAPAFLAAVDGADLPPTERAALAGAARDLLARCGAGF